MGGCEEDGGMKGGSDVARCLVSRRRRLRLCGGGVGEWCGWRGGLRGGLDGSVGCEAGNEGGAAKIHVHLADVSMALLVISVRCV